MWITNGTLGKVGGGDVDDDEEEYELGDMFLVYARTGLKRSDITQFIVERGMERFSLGSPIKDKLGMRASMTAELVFVNVHCPSDSHVVGQVHEATLCMMRNLEIERLALAAMGIGIARRCFDEMKAYAVDRTGLFGQANLYAFGQVQQMIVLDDDDDETQLQASEQNKTASDMTRTMFGGEQAAQADNTASPAEHDQNKENMRENVRVVGATTTQREAEARAGSQDHDQNFSKNYGHNGHPERANEKQGSEFERANEKQGNEIKRTNQKQMTYREALVGLDNSEPSSEDNSEPSSDF